MSIKNTAVSAVLGLMFLSLLIIYLITVPSPLITFLSVLIMLVGLIMAQSNNWRDIFILAAISVIMSMRTAVALPERSFSFDSNHRWLDHSPVRRTLRVPVVPSARSTSQVAPRDRGPWWRVRARALPKRERRLSGIQRCAR